MVLGVAVGRCTNTVEVLDGVHTGRVHKGEPHKLLDLLNGVLDHLKDICSYLSATAGGVTMPVKCSKEESHISNHRRNDHTSEVHDLLNDTTRNKVCGIVVD